MDDYNNTPELELKEQIKTASDAGDFDTVKTLMQQLITLQDQAPKVDMTDAELAEAGVDMMLLQKERELREQYHQANQDGDFIKANEVMRELRQLQKLQPAQTGVKLG
jgi:division protein CdvB (Snf7/Vps24/ESCRT-III family)